MIFLHGVLRLYIIQQITLVADLLLFADYFKMYKMHFHPKHGHGYYLATIVHFPLKMQYMSETGK